MRDILVFVSGTTPQVITETLWGLCQRDTGFAPVELHVITTTGGQHVAQLRLVDENRLGDLCGELGIPVPVLVFHVVQGATGELLEDIRNTSDNTALANMIMTVIRDLTLDKETRVHASLSGGRKTMGFFIGYAMSLYGRRSDSLYHVMVPPEFERCPEFFYKPKESRILPLLGGGSVCTTDATIEIAELPFLRLRKWLDEPILNARNIDFGMLTQRVQAALQKPVLTFHDDDCRIIAGGHSFVLRPQLYVLYRVLAQACAMELPGAGPAGVGSGHSGWLTAHDFTTSDGRGTQAFLRALESNLLVGQARLHWTQDYIRTWGGGSKISRARMAKLFNPIFARLREALTTALHDPALRREFWVETVGRNPARYGLLVAPGQIEITS